MARSKTPNAEGLGRCFAYAARIATFSNDATEGRGVIRALLNCRGDIRVQSDEIEVHLEQLSVPRYTLALQSLCQQLNAMFPRLHETYYRLRFFVKTRPIGE